MDAVSASASGVGFDRDLVSDVVLVSDKYFGHCLLFQCSRCLMGCYCIVIVQVFVSDVVSVSDMVSSGMATSLVARLGVELVSVYILAGELVFELVFVLA